VFVDPADPGDFDRATITARLLDVNGSAVVGEDLEFSSSLGAGSLSLPNPVTTGAGGIATNTLTVRATDDVTSVTVNVATASGGVFGSVTVDVTGPGNNPPDAVLTVTPSSGAGIGDTVDFFGGNSTDPDGDISCYRFSFSQGAKDASSDLQSLLGSGLTRTQANPTLQGIVFDEAVTFNVQLEVSDDDLSAAECNGAEGLVFDRSDQTAPLSYTIACETPVADAVISQNNDTVAPFDVVLDGSGSTPSADIVEYRWTCNNQAGDIVTGEQATCTYQTAGTRTVTLRVTTSAVCGSVQDTDTVQVTVP
jgi:hypothetical protein